MAGASFNNDLPNFQTLVSLKNSSLDFPKWSNTLFTAVVNLKNKNKNKGKPQLYVFMSGIWKYTFLSKNVSQ